jgi:hypothetical protein
MPEMILQIQSISFQLCISPSALQSPFNPKVIIPHHWESYILFQTPYQFYHFFSQVCKGGAAKDQLTPIMVIMIRPPILLLEMIHTRSHRLRTTSTHMSAHIPLTIISNQGTYNRLIPPSAESLSLLLYTVLVKLELEGEEGELHRLQEQNLCFEPW